MREVHNSAARHIICLAVILFLPVMTTDPALAGPGWIFSNSSSGMQKRLQTFYANSPSGIWTDSAGTTHDSGTPLRKFVDPLPGICDLNGPTSTLGQCIPLAIADTSTYPGSDYFEIAVVEYREQLHSDLPPLRGNVFTGTGGTLLRGYVQLETKVVRGEHIPLLYPDGSPITDMNGVGYFGVHKPHYLGPLVTAYHYDPSRPAEQTLSAFQMIMGHDPRNGKPTRVKFVNLLPTGSARITQGKVTKRNGDLFIPVDKSLMGSATGPNRETYTENRVAFHLHGGDNPWISDGTPFQWITPAKESSTTAVRGPLAYNAPDMPDPGAGAMTYFWPNGLSARFLWYHDHTMGLTRLNTYVGNVAGYLLLDQVERRLAASGVIPDMGETIPLIFQDKTFVPKDIALQDARWDQNAWGRYGDLWFGHVYEPKQDPTSKNGANPAGRWDYGPWVEAASLPTSPLPDGSYGKVSTIPESYGDTAMVNGAVYPTLTVQPKAYRFLMLNGANDRILNLGIYVAVDMKTYDPGDTSTAVPCDGRSLRPDGTLPPPGECTEVRLVEPERETVCPATNTLDPVTGQPWMAAGEQKPCKPASWPQDIIDAQSNPVPDPLTAGPKILQFGTEGGFLPNLVEIPSQPINLEPLRSDTKTARILAPTGLFLGNGERADTIVDFSAFAGQTLILYNDAPAPVPGRDPRLDYYTGNDDETDEGGAPETLPGYGPNIRTMMQIVVAQTPPAPPFKGALLASTLPGAYARTQPPPVVAESAYNTAFGTAWSDRYARICTGNNGFRGLCAGTPGSWDFIAGDTITFYKDISSGKGIFDTKPTTVPAGALATGVPVYKKSIQERFDSFGRGNATLGIELPQSSRLTQASIPLSYIDPVTETIKEGETQIWQIAHNGEDTHPVHFHLLDLQVINRIDRNGTVKPPPAVEMGWKETIDMHPLEDIVVAVRPKRPVAPFGLPLSIRYRDPTQVAGTTNSFTQTNLATGIIPFPGSNVVASFGWEYIWHCHMLGHEENDFMRPLVFAVTNNRLNPITVTARRETSPSRLILTWKDTNPNPSMGVGANNVVSYKIFRRAVATGAGFTQIGTALANAFGYEDTTVEPGLEYEYQVVAVGGATPEDAALFRATTDALPSNTVKSSPFVGVKQVPGSF